MTEFRRGSNEHQDWKAVETPAESSALVFHENSKLRRIGPFGQIVNAPIGGPAVSGVVLSKACLPEGAEDIVGLPDSKGLLGASTLAFVLGARRSKRAFAASPISLEQLSATLYAADGVSRWERVRDGSQRPTRTAGSGGARYPLEMYAAVHRVSGLQKGTYHYRPETEVIEPLGHTDPAPRLKTARLTPLIGEPAVTFLVTATWKRIMMKYGERGYRLALLEAGSVLQNLGLAAACLGLAGTPLMGCEDICDSIVEADGFRETTVIGYAMGNPA